MKKINIGVLEMFGMIENFTDDLFIYMQEHKPQHVDRVLMTEMAAEILQIFKKSGLEGRIGIIVLLQMACAMYRVATEQDYNSESCHQLLN